MAETRHPLRICFVSLRAYPLFNPDCKAVFGGAELDWYMVATELAKDSDFQVNFIVGDYGQPDEENREGVRLLKSLNVEKNLFVHAGRIWRAMHNADSRIYLAKGLSLGTCLYELFCHRRQLFFVLRTAHSRECDGSYLAAHPLRAWFIRRTFSRAARVYVQNACDAVNLQRTVGVSAIVLPNGTRLSEPSNRPRDTVLWAARSEGFKQPDLYLRLAQECPDVHFTMICPRYEGDRNYDNLVDRARSIGNLDFVLRVPYHQMPDYFQRARVFVNTSDSEGFANTFIQACQTATPVLTWRVNPDDFLKVYQCGLCAEENWDKFVAYLRRMLNEDTARQFGLNGFRYVSEHHDITRIVEEYKKMFRELLTTD